jgi:hypothetical protein
MMRRLISMLAAGVLAAGTLFATAGAASAGAAAVHHRADCTPVLDAHLHITRGNTYFLGTPVSTFSGAVVRLKPNANRTTNWTFCRVTGNAFVLFNRGLALTSRDSSPGGLVTVSTAPGGMSGSGFASQRWDAVNVTSTTTELLNEKTLLLLRVRNSCCFFGQTVTTGAMATDWNYSF